MQQIAPLLTHYEIQLTSIGLDVVMFSKQPNAGEPTSCEDITVALSNLQHVFSQVILTAIPALQTVCGYKNINVSMLRFPVSEADIVIMRLLS